MIIRTDYDYIGTLFVFSFYDIYWTVSNNPNAPTNPEIYISTLSSVPVSISISSPRRTDLNWAVSHTQLDLGYFIFDHNLAKFHHVSVKQSMINSVICFALNFVK